MPVKTPLPPPAVKAAEQAYRQDLVRNLNIAPLVMRAQWRRYRQDCDTIHLGLLRKRHGVFFGSILFKIHCALRWAMAFV